MITLVKFKRVAMLVATVVMLGSSAFAWADDHAPYPRILVTGVGSVDVAPDMAILTLTVSREAETAGAALAANSTAMSAVLEVMRTEGVEKLDLQTSQFSIRPNYVYLPPKPSGNRKAPRLVGYTVRNSLTARVHDIDRVGVILDKTVAAGVNEGGNIAFTNDDPAAAITQARALAMQDAIAKAKTLAAAAGVKLGKLLEISEQFAHVDPLLRGGVGFAMMASADAARAVPVAAGENTYKVTVNVSYAIDQ